LADGVAEPATSRAVRGPPNEEFGLPPGRDDEGRLARVPGYDEAGRLREEPAGSETQSACIRARWAMRPRRSRSPVYHVTNSA
jgi:hypothetical protein